MNKRLPSRNSRSKGVKVKHVLQICVLLGVCFWLIYQVKRSHDKKKELEEDEAKGALGDAGNLKLGRKDLHPRVTDVINNDQNEDDEEEDNRIREEIREEQKIRLEQDQEEAEMKHREEEEEEKDGETEHEARDVEGSRHEDEDKEEEEEETGREENEDEEGGGGGDEEIDERGQDKMEGEAGRDVDLTEEEKERLEFGEEEVTENTGGEEIAQLELETSTEDLDQDGGAQDAQEVLYKADDASSAVTLDTTIPNTESENISTNQSNNNLAETNSDAGGDAENQLLQSEESGSTPTNVTSANNERLLANSKAKSNDDLAASNTLTGVTTEAGNGIKDSRTEVYNASQHNEAAIRESTPAHEAAVNGSISGGEQSDSKSNFTSITENVHTNGRDAGSNDIVIKPEVTAEGRVSSGLSSGTGEAADATRNEKQENSDQTDGKENPQDSDANGMDGKEGIHDPIDTSDSFIAEDVKENWLDLGTLPEDGLSRVNDRNAAAE